MAALKIIRIIAWGAVLVAIGVLAGVSGILTGGRPEPVATNIERPDISSVGGPFELTTHKGEKFTEANVTGKPYLDFFGFTHCPDICPTTLFELTGLMKDLGPDADLFTPLFITVDPERDTQQSLAQYMGAFDSRITGLRGTPEQTDAAVKAFKAYYKKVPLDGGNYTMDHTAGVFLMSANGRFVSTLDMHEPRETRLLKLRRLGATTP